MNYQKIYNKLVSKDMQTDYIEVHHIVPKCMGGTDEQSNLVKLTTKAHFLAHLLLCKIYPENIKLKFAFNMMSRVSKHNKRKLTATQYALVKRENSKALSVLHSTRVRTHSENKNRADALRGTTKTEESKKRMSEWQKGKPKPHLKGKKRPGIGGRKKGCQGKYHGTNESNAKQSATKKRNFSPSFNTQGYEILTPTGFQKFDGVAFSGLVETLKFTLVDGRSITVSKKHRFETDKLAKDYVVGDELSGSKVVAIEHVGKKHTYDILEVAGNHLYLANDIVNHNCQFVVDENLHIIPEFKDEHIVNDSQRDEYFKYYRKYICFDIGVVDPTSFIYGFYDYSKQKLIIECESQLQNNEVTTENINNNLELFQDYKTPFKTISDNNNLILIQDLNSKYQKVVVPVKKDSLQAMISELRWLFKSDKILISHECKNLINQLRNGIWNKHKTEFARQSGHHNDFIAAITYLVRSLNEYENPVPVTHNTTFNHYVPSQGQSESINQLMKLFN